MSIPYMQKRDGFWYYARRVPKKALSHEKGPFIIKSTGIRIADDPRGIVARRKVAEFDAEFESHWSDKLACPDPVPPPNELGAAVEEQKHKRKMNQIAFGLRLEVDLASVARLERDETSMTLHIVLRNPNVFNVSLDLSEEG